MPARRRPVNRLVAAGGVVGGAIFLEQATNERLDLHRLEEIRPDWMILISIGSAIPGTWTRSVTLPVVPDADIRARRRLDAVEAAHLPCVRASATVHTLASLVVGDLDQPRSG